MDPYAIAHNAILAHAQAVAVYRGKYQKKQQGTIGIVLNTGHFYPLDSTNPDDVAAAQRNYGEFRRFYVAVFILTLLQISSMAGSWTLSPTESIQRACNKRLVCACQSSPTSK